MSPAEKQARDEMAERKMQKATDKAYMGSLTTTEPSKEPRDAVRGQKGYAKGGSASARADGCCTKGKTKGRMI